LPLPLIANGKIRLLPYTGWELAQGVDAPQ